MSNILSIEYKNVNFWNDMLEFILSNVYIIEIEYERNYEMKKTNSKKVKGLKTTELLFKLNNNEIVDSYISLQNRNNSLPRILGVKINYDLTAKIKKHIELDFIDLIESGYVNDNSEIRNIENVEYVKRIKGRIPNHMIVFPNPNYIEGAPGMDMIAKEFISIESLPGHSHQMNYDEKLWFGSSWQMYFSPVYYKYIPKFLFDDFQDCYEHKVFENGLRRITLYENPEDYDLPESRAKQWAFRQQVGIDSIAHELTRANNRIEPENLPVLITKQGCKVGQTRVTRFLDKNKKLVSSNKADYIEVREYLDDGITLVFEEMETT